MTTKNLLHEVVEVSVDEIRTSFGSIGDLAEEIKSTKPALRSESEKSILKIARASRTALPLINLSMAIRVGGVRPDGYPNLAVAHYDSSICDTPCQVQVNSNGEVTFSGRFNREIRSEWGWEIKLPQGTLPEVGFLASLAYPLTAESPVPLVPLTLRQKTSQDVYLLYEVAEWKPVRREVDPFLLKRIAGDVYAILGTWDVTKKELEAYQLARHMGV